MEGLRPPADWYEMDTSCDIMDPDGWDREMNETTIITWYHVPITYHEYKKRLAFCTVTEYMRIGHRQPF